MRRGARIREVIFIVAVALASIRHASASEIDVRVIVPDESGPLRGRVVLRRNVADAAEAVREANLPATVKLQAEQGSWELRVEAAGYWSEPQRVNVTDAAVSVESVLWRAGVVEGSVQFAHGDSASAVDVILRSSTDSSVQPKEATIHCPLTAGSFECAAPAGVYDIKIHAASHVSKFVWNAHIAGNQRTRLVTFLLNRGASLVGRVQIAEKGAKLHDASVIAQPMRGDGRDSERGKLISLTARVNDRGFFQIAGLAPGMYSVAARQHGYVSSVMQAHVVGDLEATLTRPITLSRPQTLTIRVVPPHDPAVRPWQVFLEDDSGANEIVATAATDDVGIAQFPAVRFGRYSVLTGRSDGAIWNRQEAVVEDRAADVSVILMSIRVDGHVQLGERSIAANLTFGGEHGSLAIPAFAAEDGSFSVDIPALDQRVWQVAVKSTTARVHRTVDVTVDPKSDSAHVTISLPATLIHGRVIDELRNPAVALVTVRQVSSGAVIQQKTDDGNFEIAGLDAGAYVLQADGVTHDAESTTFLQSDAMPVNASDDPTDVDIVLRKRTRLQGLIVSPYGPIPGAQVVALPTDTAALINVAATTDVDGSFTALLPPSCAQIDFAAAAPGWAMRFFHTALPDHKVRLTLDQRAGALRIALPTSPEQLTNLRLVHLGAVLPLTWLLRSGDIQQRANGPTLLLPMIEPGEYELCKIRPEELAAAHVSILGLPCSATTVVLNAEAALTLP